MSDSDPKAALPSYLLSPIWLLLVALGAVLLFAPATGWIAVQEVKAEFTPPTVLSSLLYHMGVESVLAHASSPLSRQGLTAIATECPHDYQIQLACVLENQDNEVKLQQLRKLTHAFPGHASLYAHILRFSTLREVQLNHREIDAFRAFSSRTSLSSPSPPSTPAKLDEFDAEAEEGERLDPTNAYFPLMRAVGQFEAHQDSQALASVELVGSKSRWDDYTPEDIDCRINLEQRLLGKLGVIDRMGTASTVMLPHLVEIRRVADLATYDAVEAELSGHTDQGLAIRHAVMYSGCLMRVQSSTMIGSLVGMSISAISISRPGGALAAYKPSDMSVDQWNHKKQNQYFAYLERIHHPQEAAWAKAEVAAGRQAKDIIHRGLQKSPTSGLPFDDVMEAWIVGLVLATNVLWFSVLGIGATLLTRMRSQWWPATALFLASFALLTVIAVSLNNWFEAFKDISNVTSELSNQINRDTVFLMFAQIIGTTAIYFLPLLSIVVFAVAAFVSRRQPALLITRGASITALGLLLIYGGLLVVTAQLEAKEDYAMEQSFHHEGAYLAQQIGQPWPV